MKKFLAIILAAMLLCTGVMAYADGIGGSMTGSWQINENIAEPIPEEVLGYFDAALEGLVGATYEPISLLATQLVAGTNYCILCKTELVIPDPVPMLTLVYIYVDLQGNAQILQIADLDIGLLAEESVG